MEWWSDLYWPGRTVANLSREGPCSIARNSASDFGVNGSETGFAEECLGFPLSLSSHHFISSCFLLFSLSEGRLVTALGCGGAFRTEICFPTDMNVIFSTTLHLFSLLPSFTLQHLQLSTKQPRFVRPHWHCLQTLKGCKSFFFLFLCNCNVFVTPSTHTPFT